jgi:2-amino-4-hydroxy-6-hydroxymethyldihydropteridine diphosphokinase
LPTGFLGLGTNLGDRRANLEAAVAALADAGVAVLASSSVYETAPVGLVLDQPAFLNACVSVATELEPLVLLDLVKGIERSLGRSVGGVRHGPRVIDIDILLLGARVFASERLSVPHPALRERRFVLEPLLELAPDLELPGSGGERLGGSLALVGDEQEVRRVGPPLI